MPLTVESITDVLKGLYFALGDLTYDMCRSQPDGDQILTHFGLNGQFDEERLARCDQLIRALGAARWLAMVRADVRGSRR